MNDILTLLNKYKTYSVLVIVLAVITIGILLSPESEKVNENNEPDLNQESNTAEDNIVAEPVVEEEDSEETEEIVEIEPIVEIEEYIGMPMDKIASDLGISLNQVGNIIYENSDYKMLVESRDSITSSFVEIDIKSLPDCIADESILDSIDEALIKVGLDPKVKGITDNPGIEIGAAQFCEYGDKKYDIGVGCYYDGAYYSVSISDDRSYCEL